MGLYKNKGFWGGEHGHVHGLQELGAIFIPTALLAWTVSPILGAAFSALLFASKKADKYWTQREVDQSLNMGRVTTTPKDLERAPDYPNKFWTKDAIADVKFPRKIRPLLHVGSFGLCYYAFLTLGGVKGMLLKSLIIPYVGG